MNHEELSRAPLTRFLFMLLGGVIIAGCGNNSSAPTDAHPADTRRDTTDVLPRDTNPNPGIDAPGTETARTAAATPVFVPAGGIYSDPQTVTITSGSAGVQIRYTVDGSEPTAASPLYATPIAVSATTTVKAIAVDPTGTLLNSALASATYTLAARVPPPTLSPAAGTFTSAQVVNITDGNPNATIRYTVDGTEPTATSTVYTMPITVSTTMTIKAIASLTGMVDSLVSIGVYTIQTLAPAATPTFTPAAGTYAGAQNVTIATTTTGAEIYYTIDGTEPTEASLLYTAPVRIANSSVLKARAYATGKAPSAVATAAYTITTPAAAKPTISPNGGTFTAAQAVTLATTETGGQIIYTTNGTIPNTTTGTIYTAPFTLAQTATVNAIVVNVPGKEPSAVATAVFTINIELPIAFDKQTGTYNNDVSVAITSTTVGATVCYTKDGSDPACSATGTCASGQSTAGAPVVISGNATTAGTVVRARACKASLPAGPIVGQTYTMAVAPVVFTPAAGVVAINTSVTLSSTTIGAEIRYREDSTDPTCTTGTVVTAPLVVTQSKVFRAIACKANYNTSAVVAASYGVKLTTPIALQLDAGNQLVAVTSPATASDTIDDLVFALGASTAAVTSQVLCYSVNGTAPTCTATGTCNTSVTGVFSRTLQADANPIHGRLSNIVGDAASNAIIAAPTDGTATLGVKAAFCAPNYGISDVTTVTYNFKVATPTLSRATGTTTLAGEGANDVVATTTTGAKLRYYQVAAGDTLPTLSCTGTTLPTGVHEVDGITITLHVNGGESVGAIACRPNYTASDIATANYPLPGTTAAPVLSTAGTSVFNNDLTAGSIKITDTDIPNVGDTVSTPAGVVCWSTLGVPDCNESATAPTCTVGSTTYVWTSTAAPAVSNLPLINVSRGVRLRAIACAPGKAKSALADQTFVFQVATPVITPPAHAEDRIGVGEVLTFSSTTTGATFRYIKGSAGPAPTCSTGTLATSGNYRVTNEDANSGSPLVIRVVACKNQYDDSVVPPAVTYSLFRGAAAVFNIPPGTYGDVFQANSSNSTAGPLKVSVPDTTNLVRICVNKGSTAATCSSTNTCVGSNLYDANGVSNDGEIPWSFFDSTVTLNATACYSGTRQDAPATTGTYTFQVAPLTVANTTATPNPTPFAKTQTLVFRVGNEADGNTPAVRAPWSTEVGSVQLCYTTDGAALSAGCAEVDTMKCVGMERVAPSASATYTMNLDSTTRIRAKACKDTMARSNLTDTTITIPAWVRPFDMAAGNDFHDHVAQERFTAMTGYYFFTTWDTSALYLGWQGCGLNTSNDADKDNFTLAYLGVPGMPGTVMGDAFAAGSGGARWQLKYNVGTAQAQIKIWQSPSWVTLTDAGVTSTHGGGTVTPAGCGTSGDNSGDYVIVKIPFKVGGLEIPASTAKKIAIAEGINIGLPDPNGANFGGWPFTTTVFDKAAQVFDLTIWKNPVLQATPAGH